MAEADGIRRHPARQGWSDRGGVRRAQRRVYVAADSALESRGCARPWRSAPQCLDSLVVDTSRAPHRFVVEPAGVLSGCRHAGVLGAPAWPDPDQRAPDLPHRPTVARVQRRPAGHVRAQRHGGALSRVYADPASRRRVRRRSGVRVRPLSARSGLAHPGRRVVVHPVVPRCAPSIRSHREAAVGDPRGRRLAPPGARVWILSLLPLGAAGVVAALVRAGPLVWPADCGRLCLLCRRGDSADPDSLRLSEHPARHLRVEALDR